MTKKFLPLLIIWGLIFNSCKESTYVPIGLKKLSDEELIERSKKSYPPNLDVIIKNQQGEIIPKDSIEKIPNIEQFTTDVYVNEQNEIMELVIRHAKKADFERRKIINANLKKTFDENKGVYEIEVSCIDLDEQLQAIQKSDQHLRSSNTNIDINKDLENISKVVAIMRKCKEIENLSDESKYSLWLVIQHSPPKFREEFIHVFRRWSKTGKIELSQVVMMEDRMLLDKGEPQIYGTQVIKNPETGKMELYQTKDVENLNKRRDSVGFEPIEQYLERFN